MLDVALILFQNIGMEKLYPINEAAQILGVHIDTLRRWERQGNLRAVRTIGGRRQIPESEIYRLTGGKPVSPISRIAVYARVSSRDQKAKGDLDRQIDHLKSQLPTGNFEEAVIVTDVASGLSDRRPGLRRLMEMAAKGEITDLAITYKDRLTRFGFGYLEAYFASHGVRIHIIDGITDRKSLQEELVEDLLAIVTSFSGKLYGLRSHENARELVAVVKEAVTSAGNGHDEGRE